MANALLAWPVSFAAASYVLRVGISGVFANVTVPFTVGRYYFMVGDNQADADGGVGGVGDLLRVLELAIETHPSTPSVTITLDANWMIRVAVAAGTIQLLWANGATTLDEAVFGFANADTATAAAVTGTLVPQGLFRPGKPIVQGKRPTNPIVGGLARSVSGRTRMSRFGVMTKERPLFLDLMNRNVIFDEFVAASNPTGSLEYAWKNHLTLGRPFRLYEDEATRTSVSYRLNKVTDLSDPWRPSSKYAVRWAAELAIAEVT